MKLLLLWVLVACYSISFGQSKSDSIAVFPDVEETYCSAGIGYPGGQKALDSYIKEYLNFSGIEAGDLERVFCRLYISTEGEVYKVEVQNTDHPEMVKIITNSFMTMPNWEPNVHLGKPSERVVQISIRINWQNNSLYH